MRANDGGPAFPVSPLSDRTDEMRYGDEGMSLRDWFAGQAMKGFAPRIYDAGYPQEPTVMEVAWATKAAYVIADAMLAEREAKHD